MLLSVVLGSAALGTLLAVGLIWIDRGAPPGFRPPLVDRTVETVTRADKGVRIHGYAHYGARVELHAPEGRPSTYLFPLLAPMDTSGRQAHVVVRTKRAPDPLLGVEELTVEGVARNPLALVPMTAWEQMVGRGYRFDDDYVVVVTFDAE